MSQTSYPWLPQSEIRGNLAIGNLRENLKLRLAQGNALHAPTILAAIGTLAGITAQQSLWLDGTVQSALPPLSRDNPQPAMRLTLNDGQSLIYGDKLNAYLLDTVTHKMPWPLWGFVGGALVSGGMDQARLPDPRLYLRRQANGLGTAAFGMPQVDVQHRPPFTAVQAVAQLWKLATEIFALPPPPSMKLVEPPLEKTHWRIVAGIVANQILVQSFSAIPPETAAAIVMETAIAASKLEFSA
jgi:hypothetical protein